MTAASTTKVEAQAHDLRGLKVLVAEDSSITSDLLKLLLSQHGHQVDIVTDGLQALAALREHNYDVALLDFRLPHMDGVQVASSIRKEAAGRKLPRLIAITGDIEALLAHAENCENFDHILPKPLDVYLVSKQVEEQAAIGARLTLPTPARRLRTTADLKPTPDKPSFFDGLGYEFLSWPDDLGTTRLSARGIQATLGDPRFDAILIKEPASANDMASIWRQNALHLLPVIDLTGTLGVKADLDGSKLGAQNTDAVDGLIRRFHDQRARLHRDLLFAGNLGERLLGRMFVSGHPLKAAYDAQTSTLVSYNTILSGSAVAAEAEAMCGQQFLSRTFFERFHVCSRCESSRLNVREECPKCRSSDLTEKPYLHHFTCAHQGPESEFRRGTDLVCPKCRRELTSFSIDYDRPGAMLVCGSCGHAGSEPAIGFICLDCCAHADGESCGTRDMFSYELTEEGIGLAQYGRSVLGDARHLLRFTELPLELVVALNAAAKRYNGEAIPFTLLNIIYQNEREIVVEHGARQFAQARDLFLENLRAALASADVIVKGQSYDFALLRDAGPEESKAEFDRLRERAQSTVRVDLGAKFQAFGPEDFT
jgi:CheY-like chemotaxis protein